MTLYDYNTEKLSQEEQTMILFARVAPNIIAFIIFTHSTKSLPYHWHYNHEDMSLHCHSLGTTSTLTIRISLAGAPY